MFIFLLFYMGTILVTVYRDISYFIPCSLFQSFGEAIFIISVPNISNFSIRRYKYIKGSAICFVTDIQSECPFGII